MTRRGADPLTVCIAGCGYFSRFHQDAWSRLDGTVRVLALADADPIKASEAAAAFPGARTYADAAAMIAAERPDLVDLVTPPATHHDLVRAAGEVGAAVLCQKPLAPSYREAVALVDLAEAAGVTLVAHENFRFMPWFAETERLVRAGAVGRLMAIGFRLRPGDGQGPDAAYLARQPYFRTMPRFLIHETGIHLIDVFRFIAGEITGVFARLRRFNPVIAGEDAGMVVFDFASGALGSLDGNRHLDHAADDTRMTNGVMLVEGTSGSIRLDGFGRLFVRPHGGVETEHGYAWQDRGYGGDCVHGQIAHAVAHLRTGAPLVSSGRAYLRNLLVEEAIYRSAESGLFVEIPDDPACDGPPPAQG